jgi:hypothetical protein
LRVELHPLSNLPHAIDAFSLLSAPEDATQDRQKNGRKNGNNGDHGKQLNDGERATIG